MFENNLSKATNLCVMLLVGTLILTGMYAMINHLTTSEPENKQLYAQGLVENPLEVIPNSVSDDENDYFVLTTDDKSFYVKVSGENNNYTHTISEVTKDTVQLNDMRRVSIERHNAPKPRSNTSIIPLPIFLR